MIIERATEQRVQLYYDLCVPDDKAAILAARAYLSYFPSHYADEPPGAEGRPPAYRGSLGGINGRVPAKPAQDRGEPK